MNENGNQVEPVGLCGHESCDCRGYCQKLQANPAQSVQPAVNEQLLEALYLAHYMISEMEQNYGNLWQINETPESLDALAMKICAAIATAEAEKAKGGV